MDVREGEAAREGEATPKPLVEANIIRPPMARVEMTKMRRRRLCPIFDAPSLAGDTVTGRLPPFEALRGLLGAVMAGEKGGKRGGEGTARGENATAIARKRRADGQRKKSGF